jgi:hypothetical protein
LPVEYAGDDRVGVVDGQAADQLDRVVIGADLGLGSFERNRQFADRAAFPADLQLGAASCAIGGDGDDDLVEQSAQELFCGPYRWWLARPRSRSGPHRGPRPWRVPWR